MKHKILHVLISPRAEGTPRIVLDWLKNKEIDQRVLFLNSTPTDLYSEFENTGCKIYSFNIGSDKYQKFFEIYKSIPRVLDEYNPDILIAWPQALAGTIIWSIGNKKIRSIIHIGCYPYYNSLFQIFYNYFVYVPIILKKGKFICGSEFLLNRMKLLPGIPKRRIKMIYNAINIKRFIEGLDKDDFSKRSGVIMVSNLETFKNQHFLVDVWYELKQKGYFFYLTFVGGGSLKLELLLKVKNLGLEDLISFTGPVNNVPELLRVNKLFLFPTESTEGFGTVMIEALASGCLVLASDIPSCSEVLEGGKWGTLIKHLDKTKYVEEIIKSMNLEYLPYSSESIKDYLKKFDINQMIKNYIDFAFIDL
jgi:glycosyltransferase involved in cell wall biosynthesis